jgi:hypothetical protein
MENSNNPRLDIAGALTTSDSKLGLNNIANERLLIVPPAFSRAFDICHFDPSGFI